ncbi:MAG: succinate dehydrogenase, cytochrome b556 subunit [Pseudomonadota bacterium]
MTTPPDIKAKRPLSPHLQVYKLPKSAISSILNRITGAAQAGGLLLFTWWLVAASIGPDAYRTFTDFVSSPLGLIIMLGLTVAFYYHLFNGIRHMVWDFAVGLELKTADFWGTIVFLLTILATVGSWFCIVTYGEIF